MTRDKLKPCPFCGSEPSHWPARINEQSMDTNEYISCPGCDVRMGKPLSYAAEDVVAQWNSRSLEVSSA